MSSWKAGCHPEIPQAAMGTRNSKLPEWFVTLYTYPGCSGKETWSTAWTRDGVQAFNINAPVDSNAVWTESSPQGRDWVCLDPLIIGDRNLSSAWTRPMTGYVTSGYAGYNKVVHCLRHWPHPHVGVTVALRWFESCEGGGPTASSHPLFCLSIAPLKGWFKKTFHSFFVVWNTCA